MTENEGPMSIKSVRIPNKTWKKLDDYPIGSTPSETIRFIIDTFFNNEPDYVEKDIERAELELEAKKKLLFSIKRVEGHDDDVYKKYIEPMLLEGKNPRPIIEANKDIQDMIQLATGQPWSVVVGEGIKRFKTDHPALSNDIPGV